MFFSQSKFYTLIKKKILHANSTGYLKNLIIDEAHIVIEWGSAFRKDFQCLDAFQKQLLKSNKSLRTYLLSATFSKRTADDLKKFYSDNIHWIEIFNISLLIRQHYVFHNKR